MLDRAAYFWAAPNSSSKRWPRRKTYIDSAVFEETNADIVFSTYMAWYMLGYASCYLSKSWKSTFETWYHKTLPSSYRNDSDDSMNLSGDVRGTESWFLGWAVRTLSKKRHLRRTWELRIRVFDETNPNLPCLFLFGRHLESYFEKRFQNESQKRHNIFWFSSPRAFQPWSRICHSPSVFSVIHCLFVCTRNPIQLYAC